MRSSSATTIAASSTSWELTDSSARSSCPIKRSRPPRTWRSSSLRSSRNWWRVSCTSCLPWLAELAGDVALCPLVGRVGEELGRLGVLHHLAVEHEHRRLGDACGLLHVVGDDHDRVTVLELVDQLLDLERGDRVQR